MSTSNKCILSVVKTLKPQFAVPQRSMIAYWTNREEPANGNVMLLGSAEYVMDAICQLCVTVDNFTALLGRSVPGVSVSEEMIQNLMNDATEIYENRQASIAKMTGLEDELNKLKTHTLYTQPLTAKTAYTYIQSCILPESPDDGLVMGFVDGADAVVSLLREKFTDEQRVAYMSDALIAICKGFIYKYTFAQEADVYMFCNIMCQRLNEYQELTDGEWEDRSEIEMPSASIQISLEDLKKMGFTEDQIKNSTSDNPLQLTNEKLAMIGITPEKFKEMLDQVTPISSSTDTHLQ